MPSRSPADQSARPSGERKRADTGPLDAFRIDAGMGEP